MATRRSPAPAPSSRPSGPSAWDGKVLRQACWLFCFSAAFGILFNLFYVDGIELKVRPQPQGVNVPLHATVTPVAYAGITPSKTRTTPPPSTSDPLSGFPRVSLMGAKDRFDTGSAIFLDARPAAEYKEAHIPRALNFYADEFDTFAPIVLPQLRDKDREIVAYCHGVSCELSIHLAKRLSELGYRNVKVFFGGWPEWKKAGYPVTQGETP